MDSDFDSVIWDSSGISSLSGEFLLKLVFSSGISSSSGASILSISSTFSSSFSSFSFSGV